MPYLLRFLVLPITIIVAISMYLSTICSEPWGGQFANLAASLIGSIVTILYVDRVVTRHEQLQWAGVRNHVEFRMERIANCGIAAIRRALNIRLSSVTPLEISSDDIKRRAHYADYARTTVGPQLDLVTDRKWLAWSGLARDVAEIVREVDQLVALFGLRMSPDQMAAILKLQTECRSIDTRYQLTPELFDEAPGVSKDDRDERVEEFRRAQIELTVCDTRKLLDSSIRMLASLTNSRPRNSSVHSRQRESTAA